MAKIKLKYNKQKREPMLNKYLTGYIYLVAERKQCWR